MVTVMAAGVFDILHLGHLSYLRAARELGDKLVVVVADDETAGRMKHVPITPGEKRLELIRELRTVEEAVLRGSGDMYDTVKAISPDIIALGYDQIHDEEEIRKELRRRNINCTVMRLEEYASDLDSTHRLIRRVIDWAKFDEKEEDIEGREET